MAWRRSRVRAPLAPFEVSCKGRAWRLLSVAWDRREFVAARRRRRVASALLLAAITTAGLLFAADRAGAASDPADSLIYMPYGLIHSIHPVEEVDGYLAEVDSYGIGQVIFAMPKFKRQGLLKVPRHNREMLLRFSSRAAAYDAEQGASLALTAVYNGKIGTKASALNLDEPATRANIVAGIEATLADGLSGVQLDLEPYPVSAGFIALLEEIDATFTRVGFTGRLSVTTPAGVARWAPGYLHRVSELVSQVDPLFYDSELKTVGTYQSWVEAGLAYYSENVAPATRIVPVLPSYSSNRWHSPTVENITTSTAALSSGLAAGSRVNGAGIWSGWGFLLDEEGKYDAGADRADWTSSTMSLPFSP